VVSFFKHNPQSICEILCEKGFFETMLQIAKHSEPNWAVIQLFFMAQATLDPTRKSIARKILTRIIIQVAAQIAGRGISPTVRVKVPFHSGIEEFSIDETLENRLDKGFFDYRDIVCIERRRKKSAVSLILDVSNSMQMEKIIIAALAVCILAHKLNDDYYSVIAFNDNAQLLKSINDNVRLEKLIGKIIEIRSGGSTNIEEALKTGQEELDKHSMLECVGILVTDGWVTKGGDPKKIAAKYPMLHVIQVPLGLGGGDSEMCINIAKAGRGKYSYIPNFYQLPRAIMRVLK